MHSLQFLGCALLLALTPVYAVSGPAIATHFRRVLSPKTGVYLPSDPNYASETTQRWNAFGAPSYVVSVKPALDTDVQKIIKYAYKNNISFLGTGGGHGYSTSFSSIQNGIEVDLGNFNTVAVDKIANTMTVGGSVRFGNVSGPLYDAGKEFQVGSDSCVGLLGATLGGGIGPYGGLHGLQLDALQSVRMVTGRGDILDVSATSHSGLFWGIRGAGFNFGIVTYATYKVYDFTNNGQAMNADFRIAGSYNESIYEYLRSYADNQPDALAFEVGIAYNEDIGGTFFLVNVVYAGPLAEGMKYVEPLKKLKPLAQNITEIPWKDIEPSSKFGIDAQACIKGFKHSVYSINLYQIDVPALTNFTNYVEGVYKTYPGLQRAIWALVQYPNRVAQEVPDDATAYPWRNATAYVHFDLGFEDNNLTSTVAQVGQASRNLLLPTSGSQSLEVYVNLANGDEDEKAWYGERKLPRLHALKKQYDPYRLFSHYNSLSAW